VIYETARVRGTTSEPTITSAPTTANGMDHDRRLDTAWLHSATKSVCGTIWFSIGTFATVCPLADSACDVSAATAFPQPIDVPLL